MACLWLLYLIMVILCFRNLTPEEVDGILEEQKEKLNLTSNNKGQLYKTADDNNCAEVNREEKLEDVCGVERDIASMKWKFIVKGIVTLK